MGDIHRSFGIRASKLATLAGLGALVVGSTLSAVLPASASSGIAVFVSYADSLRANAVNFPTPWLGSPNTVFEGCAPVAACEYDGGAVRVVNNTSSAATVDAVAVHIDTCTYTGWPSAVLAPGAELIVTQLATGAANGCTLTPAQMDTSDVGPGGMRYSGNCTPDSIQPTVDVTVDGSKTSYTDTGQVLNTGGFDAGACPLGNNESIQWTLVGSGPCPGSQLTLAPTTQTHEVLSTATVTATFANGCGQPLSNAAVEFSVLSGPNTGRTGTGTTDSNGQASFSYSSTRLGTDTLHATVTNLAGAITSNPVTVTWVVFFAPGGGAFVIGDREDVAGAHVLWWGAQWWKADLLSGGRAPASFKGFENSLSNPTCGQFWTTRPGNSSRPPKTVPAYMGVIVTSHVTKSGSRISGNILHIVLVKTDPGYRPAPGHRGTGVIVDVIC